MSSLIVKALREIPLTGEGGELCLRKYNLGVSDTKGVCLRGNKTWSVKNSGDLVWSFPLMEIFR